MVRLHAFRRTSTTSITPRRQDRTEVILHAWADMLVETQGGIDLGNQAPLAGTYAGADPNGLLWSGWPQGDERLGAAGALEVDAEVLGDNATLLIVPEVDGRLLPRQRVSLQPYSDRIAFRELSVAHDGVSGVFAAPEDGRPRPAVIWLHGSEGGSMEQATLRAGILAQRGLAVLALNYVAYSWSAGIEGVAPALANIPVELLGKARDWLVDRPEVLPTRVSLYGASKGAELALVAATRLPWVRSVVACVPSDVVWAGFGRPAAPGERLSSWSWQGQPLPFIAYDRYEDVFTGAASAREVHVRSRALASPEQQAAARIAVEQVRAPVLLIGAGKDQVWPSGEMAVALASSLGAITGNARAEIMLFPDASHDICGSGSAPKRADGEAARPMRWRAERRSAGR